MDESFISAVYKSLQGLREPPAAVSGVEDAFATGTLCARRYDDFFKAYERLHARLGVADEDADVEIMVNAFMDIQKDLCFKMYEYGARFGSRG